MNNQKIKLFKMLIRSYLKKPYFIWEIGSKIKQNIVLNNNKLDITF